MNLEQFKNKELDTKTAGDYAVERLGLVKGEWCAYAWSCCIDKFGAEETIDKINDILNDGEEIDRETTEELWAEQQGSHVLPQGQMIVRLVKAPNLEVARELWGDDVEVEYKTCLIDWKLIRAQ